VIEKLLDGAGFDHRAVPSVGLAVVAFVTKRVLFGASNQHAIGLTDLTLGPSRPSFVWAARMDISIKNDLEPLFSYQTIGKCVYAGPVRIVIVAIADKYLHHRVTAMWEGANQLLIDQRDIRAACSDTIFAFPP